jgi:hypothetical protein
MKPVLWIRIRIDLAVLDRIRIGYADPDPGAWKLTLFTGFQKGFCTFAGFFASYLVPTLKIFYLQAELPLLVTLVSILTRILIRMDPHWFGSLDPDLDPH